MLPWLLLLAGRLGAALGLLREAGLGPISMSTEEQICGPSAPLGSNTIWHRSSR